MSSPLVLNPSLCTWESPRSSQTDPGEVALPDIEILEHHSSGLWAS